MLQNLKPKSKKLQLSQALHLLLLQSLLLLMVMVKQHKVHIERPPGKKKEKQMLRQRASMEAMEYLVANKKEADVEKELKKDNRCRKAFTLLEERIRIEREMLDMQREMEEERIMNIDMSTLSYKQQQYYVMIPQISTRTRGPAAASANEARYGPVKSPDQVRFCRDYNRVRNLDISIRQLSKL
jgi:hypothetical protein